MKIRPEDTVQETASDIFMCVFMVVFGVLGLILAHGARDPEMLIFGAGLAVFAVVFDLGVVRRHLATRRLIGAGARGRP